MNKTTVLTISVIIWGAVAAPLCGLADDNAKVLSLKNAVETAQSLNESYKMQEEQLKQLVLARDRAWAAFVPTLGFKGVFTHNGKELTSQTGAVTQKQDYLSSTVTATLTLFKGTNIPALMSAYKQAESSKHAAAHAKNEISFEIARAYFAAVASKNLLESAKRSLKTAKEMESAAKAKVDAGKAKPLDEQRAKLQTANAESFLISAQNACDASMDYLSYLVGGAAQFSTEAADVADISSKSEDELLRYAASMKPEILAVKFGIEAADKAELSSYMDFLPTLSLSANFNATQNTYPLGGDKTAWNLLLTLDWTLWDGGYKLAATDEKKAAMNLMKLKLDQIKRKIKNDLKTASRNIKSAQAALDAAKKRLELAKSARELTLEQYKAGAASSLELVDADDALTQAEIVCANSELALASSKLELLRAAGFDPFGAPVKVGEP